MAVSIDKTPQARLFGEMLRCQGFGFDKKHIIFIKNIFIPPNVIEMIVP